MKERKNTPVLIPFSPESGDGRTGSADCAPDVVVRGLGGRGPVHDCHPGEWEGLSLDPGQELRQTQLAHLARELRERECTANIESENEGWISDLSEAVLCVVIQAVH